jgi:hypothetical protein
MCDMPRKTMWIPTNHMCDRLFIFLALLMKNTHKYIYSICFILLVITTFLDISLYLDIYLCITKEMYLEKS